MRDKTAEEILTEDSLIPEDYNMMALKHLRHLPGCFHSHDFFEINCVLAGSCTYQTPDKTTQVQAVGLDFLYDSPFWAELWYSGLSN